METSGYAGGGSSQPTIRDVRLLERAIRKSWELPEATRQAMLALPFVWWYDSRDCTVCDRRARYEQVSRGSDD